MHHGLRGIQAALERLAAEDADAGSVADAARAAWLQIAAALSPIIGRQGVAALYRRSLHLAQAHNPALAAAQDDTAGAADFSALRAALAGQTSGSAVAANNALLDTFHELLSRLIGASLTERLLGSVSDAPSTDLPAQDPLP